MTNPNADPFDAAMDAEWTPPARTVFGQAVVSEPWFCALVKGEGKVPFDEGLHSDDQKRTAIEIGIMPLPGTPSKFPTERSFIAESKEWAQIVKPSLKALGLDLRSLNDRYVQAEMAICGRYTNRNGEEKEKTTFKFVKVFADIEECLAASEEFFQSRKTSNGTGFTPAVPNTSPIPDPQRATMAKFLMPLWEKSGHDTFKFLELVANTSGVKNYFDANSPEVLEIITEGGIKA